MSKLVDKILRESYIGVMNLFDRAIPNRYGFILSDKLRFPDMKNKIKIIKELENYRLKSGDKLPIQKLNPNLFIATQDTVDGDKIKRIAKNYSEIDKIPFVVKFNNQYYLIDGHHRISVALIANKNSLNVHVYDIDLN